MKHAALVLALCSMGPGARVTDRNWSQPRGNAEGTCVSTVAPVRALPVEEWRVEFDALRAGPVSWGDVVYVVAEKGRERKLFAFDVRGGAALGSVRVGKGERSELAVWQGTVVLIESDAIRTFVHKKDRFQPGKTLEGKWMGSPAIHDGLLFLGSWSHLFCLDLKRLEVVASCEGGFGRPALATVGGEVRIATQSVHEVSGYEGDYLHLERATLRRVKGSVELVHDGSDMLGMVGGRVDPARSYCAPVAGRPAEQVWFLFSGSPLKVEGADRAYHGVLTTNNLAPVVTDVAIHEDSIFGFDAQGTLIRFRSDGRFERVVAPEDLPSGARPGPATIASGVLYLGNWAVELATARVLWCEPGLEPDGALLPVSDGRLVYTRGNALVGLVDPMGASAEVAAAEPDPSGPVLARPTLPGSGEALVLGDGVRVAGRVERIAEDAVRVAPVDGTAARELPLSAVALIESASGIELVGEAFSVLLAFERALDAECVDRFADLFERYASGGHVEDARRLLEEARGHRLAPERDRALEARLSGKARTQRANAEAQRARILDEERGERAALVASFVAASDWCERAGLTDVAAVLLARALAVHPDGDPAEIEARAARTMPAAFPWRDGKDAARQWLAWAQEILPAGAAFLPPEDPLWKRAQNEPWSRAGTIALRTRNLLVFSRAYDPTTLGSCLRRGEGTLRALSGLLGLDSEAPRPPLDVRLHATREDYLAERSPEGFFAMPWSAGCYSPDEKISRFYVPKAEGRAALERDLHLVVAHELTHHFLDERWIQGARNPRQSGFWMVEGFARFAEDQVLELGRGRSFDDPTVKSLDATVAVWKADGLIDTQVLVGMSQLAFHALSSEPAGVVQLRNTIARVAVSQLSLFYEESGSLVFFLLNRRGPEGRAAFLGLMKDYFSGKEEREPWKALGFASAEELQRDFVAFLETLAQ